MLWPTHAVAQEKNWFPLLNTMSNVIQSRTANVHRQVGPTKRTGAEQTKKENFPPGRGNSQKSGQKDPQRAFGTNITNRTTRTVVPKTEEIEFAFYNEREMREESPFDRLDMKKLRQPCDLRKRTPKPLLEESFALEPFDISAGLGTPPHCYSLLCRPRIRFWVLFT
jgi:hypothetical protein